MRRRRVVCQVCVTRLLECGIKNFVLGATQHSTRFRCVIQLNFEFLAAQPGLRAVNVLKSFRCDARSITPSHTVWSHLANGPLTLHNPVTQSYTMLSSCSTASVSTHMVCVWGMWGAVRRVYVGTHTTSSRATATTVDTVSLSMAQAEVAGAQQQGNSNAH